MQTRGQIVEDKCRLLAALIAIVMQRCLTVFSTDLWKLQW